MSVDLGTDEGLRSFAAIAAELGISEDEARADYKRAMYKIAGTRRRRLVLALLWVELIEARAKAGGK